ncbi:MAG: hypothetical protein OEV59_08965 [Deltaproteobacteria bacterium]|nr:hypothetical protein [Deltaproteobacteria bacterium]
MQTRVTARTREEDSGCPYRAVNEGGRQVCGVSKGTDGNALWMTARCLGPDFDECPAVLARLLMGRAA